MAPTSLLDLPPELRERILCALLVQTAPIPLQPDRSTSRHFAEPNISRVSHAVREESLDVFYANNTFCIDNRYRPVDTAQNFGSILRCLNPSSIARIRHLRLDWNSDCQANTVACFVEDAQFQPHMCAYLGPSYSASVYMVACCMSLTTEKPGFDLSISYVDNELCKLVAKPIYEKMYDMILPSLPDLEAGRRRRRLTAPYILWLLEVWQGWASFVLSENSVLLERQRQMSFSTGGNGNYALQDYQMQLMLLEQQNKKRRLMAKQTLGEEQPSPLPPTCGIENGTQQLLPTNAQATAKHQSSQAYLKTGTRTCTGIDPCRGHCRGCGRAFKIAA